MSAVHRASAVVLFALLVSALGCGAVKVPDEPARAHFLIEPENARVVFDGRFVGSARILRVNTVRSVPGTHAVSIEAPGHFPHDLEIKLVPGTTTVRVKLRAVPE